MHLLGFDTAEWQHPSTPQLNFTRVCGSTSQKTIYFQPICLILGRTHNSSDILHQGWPTCSPRSPELFQFNKHNIKVNRTYYDNFISRENV
jgi:hypothetical protein